MQTIVTKEITMKRFSILFVLFLSIGRMHAQEPEVDDSITTDHAITHQIPTEVDPAEATIQPEQKPTKPKPKNAAAAFTRFVRLLVALLRNPEVKENLILIEHLIVAIVQTAQQISQATGPSQMPTRSNIEHEELIAAWMNAIVSESKTLRINRACTHNKQSGMDPETKAILMNFAAIVQSFFNILQDPENNENVAPNIMGMVGGMGNIITIATAKGISLNTQEEINSFAHELDTEAKRSMHRIIFNGHERHMLISS